MRADDLPRTADPPAGTPRSAAHAELVARADAVLPGGTTNSARHPAGLEFLVERGAGAELFDVDGRRYLDFVLGGGPLVLGHADPRLLAVLQRAAALGGHHYALHRRTVELAERIAGYVPSAEMVRFTGSGSEATFHALRLARAATGRAGIVKFDGAYHGHHDLGVWSFEQSPTDPPVPFPESAGVQEGVVGDVVVLPFNDPGAVTELLEAEPERFAAVICEPFQRALAPLPGFLDAVRRACDRSGTVLIFDEVVTGFRFAPGGAQERYGVLPDLTTLGKALAGGLPLAALTGRRRLMEHLGPGGGRTPSSFHCGTFNGWLLGVESAHATLDILVEQGGLARLEELGGLAADALRRVCADRGVPVQVSAAGGVFQPWFGDRPVTSAAGIRATDLAMSAAWHRLLLQAGVYKLAPKGYVGLAHDQGHVQELAAAAGWALGRLTR
ncbi:MAG TPA: aminotransferase class III-fold pyridoxal phosphate-dependent enzyme [Actinomycetes bacterium]|jgi:glutamate-1-semialdehyde 2,1-aminomutase|nr:aminotransferase class III-fold pyridoxal phosphate-dependent enzyme [Actinomycetes bacterium]